MYKKYKLFIPLTREQIKQLQVAGIEVDSYSDLETIDFNTIHGVVSLKSMPVFNTFLYIKTPQQETLFGLLFPENSYRLEEWCTDEYYTKFS
jgi:hypothetical protein